MGRATPITQASSQPNHQSIRASSGSSGPAAGLSGSGDEHVEEIRVEQLVARVLDANELARLNVLARELLAFSSFAKLILFTVPDMTWRPVLVASRGASEQNKQDHMDLADAYDLIQERRGDPRRTKRDLLGVESERPVERYSVRRSVSVRWGRENSRGTCGDRRGGAR
jgi:hypothetical protein